MDLTNHQSAAPEEGPKRSEGPGAGAARPQGPQNPPPPEVLDRPKRRVFTAEYKARIVEEAEGLPRGEISALLRREGLYSSHLTDWRRLYLKGGKSALTQKKRGPTVTKDPDLKDKNAKLERENARLRHRLAQAEMIIEIQKKVSEILEAKKNETNS